MLKLQENQFDPYIEEVNMLPIVKILEPTDSLKWKTTRFPHTESTFVYEYFNFKVLNSGSGNSHEKVPILIVTNSNIGKNQVKIGGLNETNFFFYLYQEIVIFYTEILTGEVVLWRFFSSETSEKIHNSTFLVKISVVSIERNFFK